MEKFVYNQSDAVTTIDQIFYDTIAPRFKDRSKLSIIPNFVDTEIYKPMENRQLELNKIYFPDTQSLKLMYAGNIGHAQDWQPLIDLAKELKDEDVEFFVIGEGGMKSFLKKEKQSKGLYKVHLIPYQARELMPSLLAYSDIQFIFMAPQTEGHGFPSKVYTIMACAKPLIVCSGANTPIVNFLEEKDCAYLITEKDIRQKVVAMASIIRSVSKEKLAEKGWNGYKYIVADYSRDSVTEKYVELGDKLLIQS